MNFDKEELDDVPLGEFFAMNTIPTRFDSMWADLENQTNSQIVAQDNIRLDDDIFNLSQGTIDYEFKHCEVSTSGSQNFNELLAYVHPPNGDSQGQNINENNSGNEVNENLIVNEVDEINSEQTQTNGPFEPPLPPVSDVPSNTDWPGEYNFNLSFTAQEKITKGSSWIYSEKLDKLFIMKGKESPIQFTTSGAVPNGSFIRALPIYSHAQHIFEVVRRCPTHAQPSEGSNLGNIDPNHLVRCQNDRAVYQTCPVTGRMSVVIPSKSPQPGTNFSVGLYSLMCYTSCNGTGINRRDIQIVFTLEHNGAVIGRKALKVRPCACPKRDKETEEAKALKRNPVPKLKRQISEDSSVAILEIDQVGPVATKRRRVDTEASPFILPVQKREHYEFLKRILNFLEFEDTVNERRLLAADRVRERQPKPIKQELRN